MKVLLVNPSFPVTYWGYQYALEHSRARAVLPPLGLITLAALLPDCWELKLIDRNIESLDDADILWAEAVFVGGMLVQAPSMQRIIARARALDRLTVVGGPAPTTAPSLFGAADVIFQGELEERLDELLEAISSPRGSLRVVANDASSPSMEASPIPRYDLLELDAYDSMSIQYSRGCPYRCEFCDIIEIYGRVPRVKTAAQVLSEMEALRALGWSGAIFVVDDNFIGNRPAVRKMLPELIAYQQSHGNPFDLSTEASVNLASDERLVADMVAAGFSQVFLGIESPSKAALQATQKTQNVRIDLLEAVESLCRAGLEVMAGFIVGFDQDEADIFEAQRAFIQASPIPIAMVGLLMALPGTQLSGRLLKEGRLRRETSGDQFDRPNFDPAMDEEVLLKGYAELLAQLYEPAAYFARCEAHALMAPKVPGATRVQARDLVQLAGIVWALGVRRPWRRHFWRLLFVTLRHAPHNVRRAMVHAVLGEHMIRYTTEHVAPRIASALAELRAERSALEARNGEGTGSVSMHQGDADEKAGQRDAIEPRSPTTSSRIAAGAAAGDGAGTRPTVAERRDRRARLLA